MKTRYKAIGFIILSAFGFSLMTTLIRLSGDVPVIQKTFFRNLVAAIVAAIVLMRDHTSLKWEKGNLPLLLVRSICGILGVFCNFYAIDHLLLADANMLNKLSPFFALILSFFFLKERATAVQCGAVVVAFIGALFIIKPGFSSDALTAAIGACGGLGAGAAYTAVRALSQKGEKSARIVFFFSAFSTVVVVPYLLLFYQPMALWQLACLLGAGFAAALGQFGITLAYANAPAKEISVYDYTQILFAALFGYLLFQQIPDGYSVLGYFIICSVSVGMFLYNRRKDREELIEH